MVDEWYARWGVRDPGELAAPLRLRGQAGLAAYSSGFSSVSAEHPECFESIVYHRKLSMMMAHCELHTPRRTELTERTIRAQPTELVIVAAHVLDGELQITQYGKRMSYGEGQLVVLALDSPFVNVVESVIDSAMLLIPKRLLGLTGSASDGPVLPAAADSLVSRSAAQFVRRFVGDAAILGHEVTPNMEIAAIRMIREAIGLHSYHERHPQHDSIMVREAALELIERNHRDPEFTADSIAAELHMSRRHLYRHFAAADSTPAVLLKERRLASALELLADARELPLDEVARRSGFASTSAMRNRLRTGVGMTPGDFRASIRPPIAGASAPSRQPRGRSGDDAV